MHSPSASEASFILVNGEQSFILPDKPIMPNVSSTKEVRTRSFNMFETLGMLNKIPDIQRNTFRIRVSTAIAVRGIVCPRLVLSEY
ncbi:hypothetical protein PHLCEN_2v2120 [Hermanssonia centrifuga]|uniref:Uncharacterized protein n=1 Tax=Hermanssonia centrifuga TaxID=98765 RepID=A0A2R6RQ17_9APHY|nr:hypothetical protein PHLCEN_2v2120 [Hermanssonia centrifuga]